MSVGLANRFMEMCGAPDRDGCIKVRDRFSKSVRESDVRVAVVRMLRELQQGVLSVEPYAKNIINELTAGKRCFAVGCLLQKFVFQLSHKQVRVARGHPCSHCYLFHLEEKFVLDLKSVQSQHASYTMFLVGGSCTRRPFRKALHASKPST